MRTVLFFDDWSLHHTQDIQRRWFRAEPWPGLDPQTDRLLPAHSFGYPQVHRSAEGWVMWAHGFSPEVKDNAGDEGVGIFRYVSQDGLLWRPDDRWDGPVARPTENTGGIRHEVFRGEYSAHGCHPFLDEREPDPARRYKAAYSDVSRHPVDSSYGASRMAVSPDGIRWTIDRAGIWRQQHTDTCNIIAWNPYTEKYQFTARAILGDRRVALFQTRDWKTFEKPMIVMHPDPMDPPVEFYGMPQFFYEGYFVGFLWREHAGSDDFHGGSTRGGGRVDAELTYSINGVNWMRCNRENFMPDRGFGKGGILSDYPCSMIEDDDGWLRVYACSCVGEHANPKAFSEGEARTWLNVSRWRKDGFCALETHAGKGRILTKCYLPRGDRILLNATVAQLGYIRAELRNNRNQVIPGFELDKCVPIEGDGHALPLQWRKGDGVVSMPAPGNGVAFRIYFEMEQARLYALRLDADLLYGFVPETTMNGDYIPNNIDGWSVAPGT